MNNNRQIIKEIVDSLNIHQKKEILLGEETVFSMEPDPYMQNPSGKILFNELHKLIYSRFYIQPCARPSVTEPTKKELEDNIALLSAANASVTGFDEGWTLEEETESIIAFKEQYRIMLKPGEYLNVLSGPDRKRREVKIYRPKEYAGTHEAFYFAFSNKVYNSDDDFVVRFYFNTSFEGNLLLLRLLTKKLNEAELQFTFKCLIHPFYYGRSDTSVLYVNKQDADFVSDLLMQLYPLFENTMRDQLPLFLYPIAKGIGFAEQPSISPEESFGTHFSKIIAAGIMKAVENDLPKEAWFNEVMKHIQVHHGYADESKLYRNPQSYYPYSFVR